MKTRHRSTVVGVFQNRLDANQAVAELDEAGFDKSKVGVALRHPGNDMSDLLTAKDTHAEGGAMAGALTGLGLGALAGLGVLAGVVPVVGHAIAAGTLGMILCNAAAGAGIAGMAGFMIGAGLPEEEAKFYQDEFEAGHGIVTVCADSRADLAAEILARHGAYNMESGRPAASNK